MAPLFLGLDLSTQQLKAIVIREDGTIIHEAAVHFDRDLPHYATTNGALQGPDGEVTSPVAMWIESLDLLLERLKGIGLDFSSVVAVSGAGQQHGSVYWSQKAALILGSLDPTLKLSSQVTSESFSRDTAPIWQDSSTSKECRELEDAVGGAQELANISGSRAYERYTGSQIAKVYKTTPRVYEATARISLVSSFIPSLFLGFIAPIEISDASGMNLMDVLSCKWDDRLLQACGGTTLRSKLGPEPVAGGTTLGFISSWWVSRFGFSPDCKIAPFTGDNPATVVALSYPGDAILSLGTSTTFLLSIPPESTPPKRFTTSHLLAHPTDTPEAQIAMLCYKNGALAREQVRDKWAGSDWDEYNRLVEKSSIGGNGYMGLYFSLPEIIPPGVQGYYFFKTVENRTSKVGEDEVPAELHPRLILESQFLSIRSRVAAILPSDSHPLHRLVISGGSSANQTIRQLAADVFGMRVYISATKEAAAMGGALLARFSWWKLQPGNGNAKFEGMGFGPSKDKCVAEPRAEAAAAYEKLVEVYRKCEDAIVGA